MIQENDKKILEWRTVTYPGVASNMYAVSENGDIMNMITCKLLNTFKDNDGYHYLNLRKDNGGAKQVRLHRVVAWEFCEGADLNLTVDHLDFNKDNNNYRNLEWVTAEENTARSGRSGNNDKHYDYGAQADNKFGMNPDKEFVIHVCELLQAGLTKFEIYKMIVPKYCDTNAYPAIYNTISRIQAGSGFREISRKYDFPKYDQYDAREGYPDTDPATSDYGEIIIRRICELLQNNIGVANIVKQLMEDQGKQYNYYDRESTHYRNLVNCIKRGVSWTNISCEYDIPSMPKEILEEARRMHKMYSECDFYIKHMIDLGYTKSDIYKSYGVGFYPDDDKLKNKINIMVDNYIKFKKVPVHESFYIDERKVA